MRGKRGKTKQKLKCERKNKFIRGHKIREEGGLRGLSLAYRGGGGGDINFFIFLAPEQVKSTNKGW